MRNNKRKRKGKRTCKIFRINAVKQKCSVAPPTHYNLRHSLHLFRRKIIAGKKFATMRIFAKTYFMGLSGDVEISFKKNLIKVRYNLTQQQKSKANFVTFVGTFKQNSIIYLTQQWRHVARVSIIIYLPQQWRHVARVSIIIYLTQQWRHVARVSIMIYLT